MFDTIYYIILDENLNHFGFQYKLGLNIITEDFNPSGYSDSSGLSFTGKDNIISSYLKYAIYIADITIPKDAQNI